jgi:hypothetical protein
VDEGGTVTAGNAPGVTDGAAALVLAGESYAEGRGLEPLGAIVAHAKVAEEPPNLLTVPATRGSSRWRRPAGARTTSTSWRSTRLSRAWRSTPRTCSAWTRK